MPNDLQSYFIATILKIYNDRNVNELSELVKGETAVLGLLVTNKDITLPSQISEVLKISRARVAAILRALRKRRYIIMDISKTDRRKMEISLTDKGRKEISNKINRAKEYFEIISSSIGEEKIKDLLDTANSIVDLCYNYEKGNKENE